MVIDRTVTWAHFSVAVFVGEIAASAGIVGEDGAVRVNDRKRVAKALRRLRDLGVISYDPSRRDGMKSWVSIVPGQERLGADSGGGVGVESTGVGAGPDSPSKGASYVAGTTSIAPTEDLPLQCQISPSLGERVEDLGAADDVLPDDDVDPFEPDTDIENVEPDFDRDDE